MTAAAAPAQRMSMFRKRVELDDSWPSWLRKADWEEADIELSDGEVVWHSGVWYGGVWYGGVWRSGVWHGGVWHGGVWHGGVWRSGVWRSGVWHGGEWHGGEWHYGEWHYGVWRSGVWRSGVWHNGESAPRAMWRVSSDSLGRIRIGCSIFTRYEIEGFLDRAQELPEEAPARGSEQWQLLEAAVRAQMAWYDALNRK